ncbi:MAG: hypothetical protein NTX87_12290 [Planctomycetota bacterium]|nr:hypothetical protein [Planctomycetota bacterium]
MSPIVREYFRVPRGDREAFIWPPAGDLPALVERNRRLLGSYAFALAGRPVQEFRAAARAEAMALARQYAAKWGFAVDREWSEPAPIIMTGHQPPPFHPGVWIKNFLAGSLASAVSGVGLNLTVDADEARGQVYRFPKRIVSADGEAEEVRVVEVAFAEAAPGIAYEEQPSRSSNIVRSITESAKTFLETVKQVRPRALIDAFVHWSRLFAAAQSQTSSLAEALAVARHKEEEALGLRNLELPVSAMADAEAFRFFVAWMLAEHEAVFEAYNGALAEYRRVYRERSAAQPVPDLARDGQRVELPLWIWRAGEKRRRLWVEPGQGGAIALYADHEQVVVLESDAVRARRGSGGASSSVAQLAALRQAGWKVRPRALSMTLFVRLAVGDVFIHGLGGALYDKITDALFERLWGVRPPELILASCTVRLPLEAYPATPRDLERAIRGVRDWQFNPDRLSPGRPARVRPEFQALAAEKRRLVENRAATRPERHRAFLRIHDVNAALAALDPAGPAAARADLERIGRQLRYNAVLRDREYAFCFYPAEDLAAFYREVTRI